MKRFSVTAFLVSSLVTVGVQAAEQSVYPSRVVRIVVPTNPGGGVDTLGRLIAQGLTERWGRQVIVENRTGAGTMIGTEFVAKAPPDGHTLLQGLSTLAINPALHKKVPFDALRDFAPITHATSLPNIVLVHPSMPVKTVKDLIALARTRPGQIAYASSGNGTSNHLTMALVEHMGKVDLLHVPYKNASPALADLVAGEVAVMATNIGSGLPFVRSGKARALGITGATRASAAPEIPTFAETGLPGYEVVQWFGLLAPAGTPRDIIAKIHQDTAAVLLSPAMKQRLTADGATVVASSPEQFQTLIRAELEKWTTLIKAAGIAPD